MFLDELRPIFSELMQQPVAFMGGFVSGVLRLNLSEEPLSNWLEKQGEYSPPAKSSTNNGSGPQSIEID